MRAENLKGLELIFSATAESPLAPLKIPVTLSVISGCLIILSAAYCLYLIFSKKHTITRFATVHYLILAVGGLIDLWTEIVVHTSAPDTPLDKEAIRGAAQAIVAGLIWIPYFHYSRRVKNTFATGAN